MIVAALAAEHLIAFALIGFLVGFGIGSAERRRPPRRRRWK